MEFGLDKCAKAVFRRGKRVDAENVRIDNDQVIEDLEKGKIYKYLGVEEGDGIEHTLMKEKVIIEYRKRVRSILKSQLNSRNKIIAIGSYAVPILQYTFGVIHWKLGEIQNIDRKTRKLLTVYGLHHPKADVHRLYTSRNKGGRGLLQVENAYKAAIINIGNHLNNTRDPLTKIVKMHDSLQPEGKSLTKKCKRLKEELNINEAEEQLYKNNKHLIKRKLSKATETTWKEKIMHGQFPRKLDENLIDKEASVLWLKHAGLKPETESLIVAAQDQAINTKYYAKNILKQDIDSKCRLCQQYDETIDHIMSGCPRLAAKEYVDRHDQVGTLLHHGICKEIGIEVSTKWYEHRPESVVTNQDITVLWNQPIITDRTIRANRPDIVVKDRKRKECYVIEISIPNDTNVINKEAEKALKYKDLVIEIQRMWGLKAKVIPIIIGATGCVSKSFANNLKQIIGVHDKDQLQKAAILGTAHIIRKALQ